MQTLPLTDLQQNGLYNFKILIDDWVNVHNPVCKPRRVRFMQVDEQVWKMETRIETRHWHQDIEMKILASDITAAGVSLEECEGLFKKFKRYLEYEYAQAFYEDNYIQIFERDFATIVRQKRQKPELCRFCKRSASQVTFKSRAHAIPNSIGNTAIFCVDECDDCNQLFGSTIENDFGNWSSLHRTIAQISGKTGPPKFKTKKGSRIETIDSVITVTSAKDQEIIEIDETNNRVKVTVELPFAPVGVYKTFCKIALSLLPKNDLVAYADLCNWIRGSVEFPDPRCIISQTCLSGRLVNPGRATIFRKKDSASGLPNHLLVVGFGYFMYQIALPSQMSGRGTAVKLPPFSTIIEAFVQDEERITIADMGSRTATDYVQAVKLGLTEFMGDRMTIEF